MISLKKAIEVAKNNGIDSLIMRNSIESTLSVTYDNGSHEMTTSASDSSFVARGGVENHEVTFTCDILDNNSLKEMIKSMKEQKDYTKDYDPDLLVKTQMDKLPGQPLCSSKNAKMGSRELVALAEEVYKKLKSYDEKIVNISIQSGVTTNTSEFMNSAGIHYKSKSSMLFVVAEAVAVKGEVYVDDFLVKAYKDITKFNADKFVKELGKSVMDKLKSKTGVPGTKKCLLNPSSSLILTASILDHLSMFSIDQNLSMLKDTVGKKVFSDKLTIKETPHQKTPFSIPFDNEGYPTSEKNLIKDGVVMTYVYDQEMAKKYDHEPTGNGFGGTQIHPDVSIMTVESGLRPHKELIKDIEDGYLITSLSGVHSGLNKQTGDFTLSAEGYYIKDGKIKFYVNQMTVSGNIMEMMKNIVEISKDYETSFNGHNCPYILVKDIVVSC